MLLCALRSRIGFLRRETLLNLAARWPTHSSAASQAAPHTPALRPIAPSPSRAEALTGATTLENCPDSLLGSVQQRAQVSVSKGHGASERQAAA